MTNARNDQYIYSYEGIISNKNEQYIPQAEKLQAALLSKASKTQHSTLLQFSIHVVGCLETGKQLVSATLYLN
jgi:hypothetical protein